MKICSFMDKYAINISYKAIDRDIWQHTCITIKQLCKRVD